MDSAQSRLPFEGSQQAVLDQLTTERVRIWSKTPGPRWHKEQDLEIALGLDPRQVRQILDSMVADGILRRRAADVPEFQRVPEINPADLICRPYRRPQR